ncbi:amino acid permease [Alicyclobacillus dauci]|uniref:Amino acid permease n=1 Tax=Alicyclobacillus dauci TaxID=1475485 RepID=A0ABY6Z507_9BACL|nr:amino acid permease [Alicyclobacillus dauci]WAH37608.1 amino acid permease [Alicyclobacillus dauci]
MSTSELSHSHAKTGELRRSLKSRHIQMLAFGGVIGVGLFYGASVSVKLAGPAVLLDFVICGIIVAIVMRALSEMTIADPTAGSFSVYARRLFGARMGFITAGMWWFYWVATVMSELAAIGKLLQVWFPGLPAWVPGLCALLLFTASNLLVVRVFGELEYWFACLKLLAIAVFMLFGVLMMVTPAFHTGGALGVANLYKSGGFMPNGVFGVVMALSLVVQAYSGIETLAVEAGESARPEENLRRAFNAVTWRVLIVYVGSMFVMLSAFPWTYLVHHAGSPYALMFEHGGIPVAAALVNLVIILSGLSSCNTGLYGGSRMLFSMSRQGLIKTEQFATINRRQIPSHAVWATALAISVGILVTYIDPDHAYVWITSASAFASLWTWFVILLEHVAYRKRQSSNNRLSAGSGKQSPLTWIGIGLLAITFICIVWSPLTRVSVFSGVAFLVLLWLFHWLRHRNA